MVTLGIAQGAAAFGQSLGHARQPPGQENLTGLCHFGVTTPHGWNWPRRRVSVPRSAVRRNQTLLSRREAGKNAR